MQQPLSLDVKRTGQPLPPSPRRVRRRPRPPRFSTFRSGPPPSTRGNQINGGEDWSALGDHRRGNFVGSRRKHPPHSIDFFHFHFFFFCYSHLIFFFLSQFTFFICLFQRETKNGVERPVGRFVARAAPEPAGRGRAAAPPSEKKPSSSPRLVSIIRQGATLTPRERVPLPVFPEEIFCLQ